MGVFVGTRGRNADGTAALAPIVGIATAVVGGCIVPPEIFPTEMLTVARAMPQYWAVTRWPQLVIDGAHLIDIVPNVGILVALMAVAGGAAVRLLRRELSHGSRASCPRVEATGPR